MTHRRLTTQAGELHNIDILYVILWYSSIIQVK